MVIASTDDVDVDADNDDDVARKEVVWRLTTLYGAIGNVGTVASGVDRYLLRDAVVDR